VQTRADFFAGMLHAVAGSDGAGVSIVCWRIGAGGKIGNTRGLRALADCEGSETGCSTITGFGVKAPRRVGAR
jgi:hypothetical protein